MIDAIVIIKIVIIIVFTIVSLSNNFNSWYFVGFQVLIQEVYLNIKAPDISLLSLYNESKYPEQPDSQGFINSFDVVQNVSNSFCQRVRGWVQVVFTGNYTFYTSCSNFCYLYLSTDNNPANKIKIAYQTLGSSYMNWSA